MHIWIRLVSFVAFIALALPIGSAGAATAPVAVVTVFPLVATQGAPDVIGQAVARSLITGIAQRSDVQAILAPADTAQADYLKTARANGADFYVAGRVSTIGTQVSAIEQLVSTRNGVVIWQNAQLYAVPDDAIASGSAIRDAVVAISRPQYAPLPPPGSEQQAPPPAAPQSAPRTAPTRPPAPLPIPPANYSGDAAPAVSAPQTNFDGPRVVVLDFTGGALDAIKHYVPSSILRTMPKYRINGLRAEFTIDDIPTNGIVACAQNGADALMGGTIESFMDGDPGMGIDYGTHLVMQVYSCHGVGKKPTVIDIHTGNGNAQTSIDIAVDQALRQYLDALKKAGAAH